MLNLITKLAIYDPDTNEHVILTNIMEGVDGSASFGWSEEVESIMIEDGQTYEHTLNGTLDIKVMRGSDAELAIIDGVVGKRARISAITINGFLLFDGEYYVNRISDFNSSILNDHIRFTAKRQKGYISPTQSQGFYGGLNGLMLFDIVNSYTDGDGNDVLGGFKTTISSATYTINTGRQVVTTTAAGNGGIETINQIFYPFSDTPLTFSFTLEGGYDDMSAVIVGRDNHDTVTGENVTATDNTSGQNDKRISVTADFSGAQSGYRFFLFRIAAGLSIASETTFFFKDPAIRIGTNDQFSY